MKTESIVQLAVVGVVGYFGWQLLQKVGSGVGAANDATVDALTKAFFALNPLPPAIQLLGNIKFPGNLLVPLQQFSGQIRQNSNGDTFVNYASKIWQLSPSDAYGNWPATAVS